jgi:hypothetical protein
VLHSLISIISITASAIIIISIIIISPAASSSFLKETAYGYAIIDEENDVEFCCCH